MDKVICIVGSTGIGKTKLAIALAKYLNSEIINCDLIQMFKEVDILSAKPSVEEQEGIKHYLLDFLQVSDNYDIALFKKQADEFIKKVNAENKIPVIVGGSGLYLKALLYDYQFEKIESRQSDINEKYQDYSNEQLFEYLQKIDEKSSLDLHPNNRKRVLRAIDIFENSKITKSDFITKQNKVMEYDALILGLWMPRELLYERINKRVDIMMQQGLLDEVNNLYKKYHPNDYQPLQAIGYKEFIPYFQKEITLEEVIEKIKQNSRRYAKKQITWFTKQMPVTWIESYPDDFQVSIDAAILKIKEHFND